MQRRRWKLVRLTRLAGTVWVAAAWGCGESSPDSDNGRRPLTVFAASSLTEAFREAAGGFEERRAGVEVVLAFAGSQALRLQIEHGADFDVFASANLGHVRALAEAGLATDPQVFATSELAVVVPPDNPARIKSFGDLVRAERLVLGAEAVPVGAYAREALARADADGGWGAGFGAAALERVVSHESSARLARTRVELGEADAAIVYRADAVAAGAAWAEPLDGGAAGSGPHGPPTPRATWRRSLDGGAPDMDVPREAEGARLFALPVPSSLGVRAEYAIAAAAGRSSDQEDALAWIDFILSKEGRAVLARWGFAAEGEGVRDGHGEGPPLGIPESAARPPSARR